MGGVDLSKVHVIVLAYGGGDEHVPLIEAICDEGVPPDQIVLVHNPSAVGRHPAAGSAGTVIPMPANLGYAIAMNAGIEVGLRAGAELFALFTHDARLRPGALGALVEAAARNAVFGLLGPALWSRRDARVWSYGAVGVSSIHDPHRTAVPAARAHEVSECEWIDGSAMLIRRSVFEEVGVFDERYFMYFEEPEFCLRARRAGWKVGVVVDAVAEQSPGARSRPGAYAYLSTRNGLDFARRADGTPGFARLMRHKLDWSWTCLKWYLKEPDSDKREEIRTEMAGMWTGIAHFARRRWGPPPAWLPGLGDVEVGGPRRRGR